jgi:hypothetical protein
MDDDTNKFVAILNATAEIDELCFATLPGYDESRVPRGLSTTWIEVNPDIYTFLFDRRSDKVAGYIIAMPVRQDCFSQIKAGQIKDNEITRDSISSQSNANALFNVGSNQSRAPPCKPRPIHPLNDW